MIIALDKNKRPLGFLTERRCRILMERKRAVLYRVFPTVVILMDMDVRKLRDLPSYRIKIDPGSKYTGIAIVRNDTDELVYAMQIEHRGDAVRAGLQKRKMARRNRRSRETGYRRAKWGNRCLSDGDKKSYNSSRKDGWLPPSILSVADNVLTWVQRLSRWINITDCSLEAVRFDTQLLENPNIKGEEYQHGTLFGYEIREYLLEKFGHTCQYCGGESGDPVLEWEHIHPKSRGGSDRVKNAILSCSSCNRDKDNQTLKEWIGQIRSRVSREKGKRKELDSGRIERIQKVIDGKPEGQPMRYATWVSSSRRYLEKHLFQIFRDVECSSGGRTKYNRIRLGYSKEHPSVSGQSRKRGIMTGRMDTTCMPKPQAVVPDSAVLSTNVGLSSQNGPAGRRISSGSRPVILLWQKFLIRYRDHISTRAGLWDGSWYGHPDPLISGQQMGSLQL